MYVVIHYIKFYAADVISLMRLLINHHPWCGRQNKFRVKGQPQYWRRSHKLQVHSLKSITATLLTHFDGTPAFSIYIPGAIIVPQHPESSSCHVTAMFCFPSMFHKPATVFQHSFQRSQWLTFTGRRELREETGCKTDAELAFVRRQSVKICKGSVVSYSNTLINISSCSLKTYLTVRKCFKTMFSLKSLKIRNKAKRNSKMEENFTL